MEAKGRRLPRAVREREMLDAAVATFGRRGYRAASMDEIAEAAGVSKPLVYLYLNSKEDLFGACVRREAEALVAAVRAAVEDGPPDRQLWSGLRGFFAHAAESPDGWAVLYRHARSHGEPFAREFTVMREEIITYVARLIADASEASDCEPKPDEQEVAGLAHALVGAAESLACWMNDSRADERAGAPSAKEAAGLLMNFAWSGLDNLMQGQPWSPAR